MKKIFHVLVMCIDAMVFVVLNKFIVDIMQDTEYITNNISTLCLDLGLIILVVWQFIHHMRKFQYELKTEDEKAEVLKKKELRKEIKKERKQLKLDTLRKRKEADYQEYRRKKEACELEEKQQRALALEQEKRWEEQQKVYADDSIAAIYRIENPGDEICIKNRFIILGIALFVVGVIIIRILLVFYEKESIWIILPGMLLCWTLLIVCFILASSFGAIYKEAKNRVFVKTEKGELYYCDVCYSLKQPHSFRGLMSLKNNVEIVKFNNAVQENAADFIASPEFDEILQKLVKREKINTPFVLKFVHCVKPVITKWGRYADQLTYTNDKTLELETVSVHNNFGVLNRSF